MTEKSAGLASELEGVRSVLSATRAEAEEGKQRTQSVDIRALGKDRISKLSSRA